VGVGFEMMVLLQFEDRGAIVEEIIFVLIAHVLPLLVVELINHISS
jgi:hypothetical protein